MHLKSATEVHMRSEPMVSQYQHAVRHHLDRQIPLAVEKVLNYCQNVEDKLRGIKDENMDHEYRQLRISLLDQLRPTFEITMEGSVDFNESPTSEATSHRERDSWLGRRIVGLSLIPVISFIIVVFLAYIGNTFGKYLNEVGVLVLLMATFLAGQALWRLAKHILDGTAYYRGLSILSIAVEVILTYDCILWYNSEKVSQQHVNIAQVRVQREEARIAQFLASRVKVRHSRLPNRDITAKIIGEAMERFRMKVGTV